MNYTLVAESEADLKAGKISVNSPIGKGLLGKKVGEIAEIKDVINTFYCDISVSYAFQSNTIVINREDFLSSLQQASIFVDERTKGVKLVFRDDKLSIFSHSERGRAETQIEVTKQEKELEIAFNIHYLISVLEKLSSHSINMVIPGGENKSCLLSAIDDESYQYIIMPMRI